MLKENEPTCQHGIPMYKFCVKCEINQLERMIRHLKIELLKHEKKLVELRKKDLTNE